MLQRIQSLFLLAASIFAFILVFYPIARMFVPVGTGTHPYFFSYGLQNIVFPYDKFLSTYPVAILAVLSGILSLISIFLYKKRTWQIRFTVYNILITFGLAITIFFYYFYYTRIGSGIFPEGSAIEKHHFSFAVVLPFVNIILLFQAFRAIRRDDLLVKSYDRLR